jgi:AcrR family transcriptional regulator
MRADARRNRERLLSAARDVVADRGPDVPLEEIASSAGVGIATLYRRFGDRESLLREVIRYVLEQAALLAEGEEAEAANPFDGLARYMHGALDLRISAVFGAAGGRVDIEDAVIRRQRESSSAPVARMIAAAQADGTLRPDATFADVGLILVRLDRALPGDFGPEMNAALAHRHLDIVLDGLRGPGTADRRTSLEGPTLSLADLQALGERSRGSTTDEGA